MESHDRITEVLIEALGQALAEPGEQRLYRSGKLDGLFAGRTGVNGEAASRALTEGLLERTRVEAKGKTEIDWVRITPAGVEFLHAHESPVQALRDLQGILRANQKAIPVWLAEMRGVLNELEARLTADASRWTERLQGLEQRIGDTLRRLEAAGPLAPPEVLESHPWAVDALNYLDRRRTGGAMHPCPLPELHAAVSAHHANLPLSAFQDGMRQLHRRQAVRLHPAVNDAEMTQPEFALLDGDCVYYLATR